MSKSRRRFWVTGSLLPAVASVSLVVGVLAVATPRHAAAAPGRPGCPQEKDLKRRTAEQTIREHLALLQAGNLDQAMCDYADDAIVVLPTQLVTGLDNIKGGLSGVGGLLGGAIPQIQTLIATSDVVMITFSAFGTPCTLPDGSDTYIVNKGQITTQTVHDTFHSAPGFTCPAAPPGT
jgi:ketosteroid isomerase-like protein